MIVSYEVLSLSAVRSTTDVVVYRGPGTKLFAVVGGMKAGILYRFYLVASTAAGSTSSPIVQYSISLPPATSAAASTSGKLNDSLLLLLLLLSLSL